MIILWGSCDWNVIYIARHVDVVAIDNYEPNNVYTNVIRQQ